MNTVKLYSIDKNESSKYEEIFTQGEINFIKKVLSINIQPIDESSMLINKKGNFLLIDYKKIRLTIRKGKDDYYLAHTTKKFVPKGIEGRIVIDSNWYKIDSIDGLKQFLNDKLQ